MFAQLRQNGAHVQIRIGHIGRVTVPGLDLLGLLQIIKRNSVFADFPVETSHVVVSQCSDLAGGLSQDLRLFQKLHARFILLCSYLNTNTLNIITFLTLLSHF